MPLTLSVVEGPHAGRVFEFSEHDTFLVGRSRRAHFQLSDKDRFFSRIHFMIEVNLPRVRILDMNSRNGTYLNNEPVQSAELKAGDIIKAGHTILAVTRLAADEPVPDPEPPPVRKVPTTLQQPISVAGRLAETCSACGRTRKGGANWLCEACAALVANQPNLVPGYVTVRELGQGTMGQVCLAVRSDDGKPVALKMITPQVRSNPVQVERFLREADILAKLDHQNIVRSFDSGEAAGRFWFAMEYVPGTDVRQMIYSGKKLTARSAVRLICQVLQGLAHAHAQGFVHRDIKPGNLLVTKIDGHKVVKIADFGLARTYQATQMSGLTMSGEVGGTPNYMPPEQITSYREALPPADQYSTAATLYHLLSGRPLYDLPPPPACFVKILEGRPRPLVELRLDLPPRLCAAVHRALSVDPKDRFPSVSEFRRALLPFAQ
jgi:hypothetical protein